MTVLSYLSGLLVLAASAEDKKVPEDKDVVAGWVGAVVIVGLVLAVAGLCYSLVRQLRKAQAARDAGVYGDAPRTDAGDGESAEPPSGA